MYFSSLAPVFLMNSPEGDPLVKQPGHRHPDHENLLKQDLRVGRKPHPRGSSVIIQIEQDKGNLKK
jgi:hypothetical protein